MHVNPFQGLLCLAAMSVACSSGTPPQNAQDQLADPSSSVHVQAPELPDPPGPPGPFLIRLQDLFPTQIFDSAATPTHIAMAMQSDARDMSLCPVTGLPICYLGSAVIASRQNPSAVARVQLYESDTQSGSAIDDAIATDSRFIFAIREGMYVGDSPAASVAIVNQNAQIEHRIDMAGENIELSQIALASDTDDAFVACSSRTLRGISKSYDIQCDRIEVRTGRRIPVHTFRLSSPARAVALATLHAQTLVTWISHGHAFAAWLHAPQTVADLGPVTAMRPKLAAGLDDVAVMVQTDDAFIRVERFSPNEDISSNQRPYLLLNGVRYRSIHGPVAVRQGFVIAFRYDNTQQIALIDKNFKTWHIVENPLSWRRFDDVGTIDISEAHAGKFLWQTAQSALTDNEPEKFATAKDAT